MVKFLEAVIDQRNYSNGRLVPEAQIKARQELLKLNKTSSIKEIEFLADLINNSRSAYDVFDALVNGELDYSDQSIELSKAILTLYVLSAKGYFKTPSIFTHQR